MKNRIQNMRQTNEDEERQRHQDAQNEFYKAEREKMEKRTK